MNLADVFFETVKRQPSHPAIIGSGKDSVSSYHSLSQEIDSAALRLKAAGIRPHNCVGLHYPSGREYIILTYAIWRCGACVVPISVKLAPEEKQGILREISLKAIVSKTETISAIEPFQNGKSLAILEDAVSIPLKSVNEHPADFHNINSAFLRFTSGTTDASKGVVLSHETVYERISTLNKSLRIGPKDRIIWLMDMAYNFVSSIVSYLSFGATIVLCRDFFAATIVEAVIRHKGTIIYGSPVHYELMAYGHGSELSPGIRLAISTTTPLRDEAAKAFYQRFKLPLNETYGLIEVGLPCINLDRPLKKLGSVGRALPGYEIRMEDAKIEGDLKAIKLRGKGFFDAYYAPWQVRNEVMHDGWFSTGDLGVLDKEGYLYILGRSKEIIDVGGFKFFPQEVETILESHPAIKECWVYPYVHKLSGEIPYAQVVVAQNIKRPVTEKELKRYCAQHLSLYKVPETIFFVDKLPRTASGKLIRQTQKISKR